MSVKSAWVLLLVMVFFTGSASTGKVLVWPTDFSHWLNMKAILHELTARGHQVTVLRPSSAHRIQPSQSSPFQVEEIHVPFSEEDTETFIQEFIRVWTYEMQDLSFWEVYVSVYDLTLKWLNRGKIFCDTLLSNEKLLEKLELAGFDILIADPTSVCGELLAEKLHLPFIYSVRFFFGNTMERFCGGLPSPPSYVPASMGGLTDKMTFLQRMGNMFFYLSHDILFHQIVWKDWDKYYSDILVNGITPYLSTCWLYTWEELSSRNTAFNTAH